MFDYAVLGLGKTGRAVIDHLIVRRPRAKVLASDAGPAQEWALDLGRRYPNIEFEFRGHSSRSVAAKLIIKSPGLHPQAPVLLAARKARSKIVSELEFAFSVMRQKPARVIAVTGTNGKTTVTALLGHLLTSAGRKTVVAGNIGAPLISRVGDIDSKTDVVLEVSSYQLEDSGKLPLSCGILLNVTPDHIDHHGSLASYIHAKEKVFRFLGLRGLAIANREDPVVVQLLEGRYCKRAYFSSKRFLKSGACLGSLTVRGQWQGKTAITLNCAKHSHEFAPCPNLMGRHNLENQMAALLAAQYAGVAKQVLDGGLRTFMPPPHRLERIGESAKVLYINDSKATNVASTVVALDALREVAAARRGRVHLFLGGLDKGAPYKEIARFSSQIAAVYAYGASADLIIKDLSDTINCRKFKDLEECFAVASKCALPGDIVLLSPACASFDQFRDYEERGERFRELAARFDARAYGTGR
ncbi:MAG: UDP-N-acetylmuramoyl-L-alanine--D-glutamate ligase [Elusimicrobiota bacterium]